jgi:hypothetical protein
MELSLENAASRLIACQLLQIQEGVMSRCLRFFSSYQRPGSPKSLLSSFLLELHFRFHPPFDFSFSRAPNRSFATSEIFPTIQISPGIGVDYCL